MNKAEIYVKRRPEDVGFSIYATYNYLGPCYSQSMLSLCELLHQ